MASAFAWPCCCLSHHVQATIMGVWGCAASLNTKSTVHDTGCLVRPQVMAVPTRDVPLRDARAGIEARLRDTLAQWGDSELSPAPKPEDEAALQSFLRSFEGATPAPPPTAAVLASHCEGWSACSARAEGCDPDAP